MSSSARGAKDVPQKQFDLNKYPIFGGLKSDLKDWEIEAKFYLNNQVKAGWVLERNTAKRAQILAQPENAGWTVAEKRGDQDSGWQLVWHTFKGSMSNILSRAPTNTPLYATDAWKLIWNEFMGEAHIEIADLRSQLLRAKEFHGDFEPYIEAIDDLHMRMGELVGAEVEMQLVADVLVHIHVYCIAAQKSEPYLSQSWQTFADGFTEKWAGTVSYTLAKLKVAGKTKAQSIASAQLLLD